MDIQFLEQYCRELRKNGKLYQNFLCVLSGMLSSIKNVVYSSNNGDVGIYLLRSMAAKNSNMSCGPVVVNIL